MSGPSALFIGWGQPTRGREQAALDVFNDSVTYYGARLEDGTITSFEPVILDPHGGGLNGFFLVKGEPDKLVAMRATEEFQRLNVRATLIVDELGVIAAHAGDAVLTQLGYFTDAAAERAS